MLAQGSLRPKSPSLLLVFVNVTESLLTIIIGLHGRIEGVKVDHLVVCFPLALCVLYPCVDLVGRAAGVLVRQGTLGGRVDLLGYLLAILILKLQLANVCF